MSKAAQQHRVLKAKVAMTLYRAYGRVPKEQEIDEAYQITRILYESVLGWHARVPPATAADRAIGIVLKAHDEQSFTGTTEQGPCNNLCGAFQARTAACRTVLEGRDRHVALPQADT